MRIYIPSYNRAGAIQTDRLFPKEHITYVIWKEQYEDYCKHYDKKQISVCEGKEFQTLGSISNFILELMKEQDGYGIIADDDIKKIDVIKNGDELRGSRLMNIYENLFSIADGIGAHYVGLNSTNDKLKYRGDFNPFSFTKPFYTVVGVIECGLRFEERYPKAEDLDFYFRQMYKHHKVVRDNRFHPIVFKGNLGSGRGLGKNQWGEHYLRVQKKWGKKYIRMNPDGSVKGVSQPIKGV
jgi:hypothetical protein